MRVELLLYLLIAILSLLKAELVYASEKRIAITIDDAPMASSSLFSGTARTKKIIENLQGYRAGIFVIGQNLSTNSSKDRLKLYNEAGHMIGNHTYSHYTCKKVSADKFIKDIEKNHQLIKDYKNFRPIFRYPYLDECKSKEKKYKVSQFLESNGYINGYVTIVTLDWYMNNLMQKAIKNGQKINYSHLKKVYLEIMVGYINFYQKVYSDKLGFTPPHSLLLHENDLNALYLADLIAALKEDDWAIISPEGVYSDTEIVNKVNQARKNLPNMDTLEPKYINNLFKKEEVFNR